MSLETPTTSEIRQITDVEDLGTSDKVVKRTGRVIEVAQEEGFSIYQVRFASGRWLVVAKDISQVITNHDPLRRLEEKQAQTKLNDVWGRCIYMHEEAVETGIGEGMMRTNYTADDMEGKKYSVYPEAGGLGHYIGFRNNQDYTFYFDLTARVYLFTPSYYDEESVFNGLAVIEPRGNTTLINRLYSTHWVKD